MKNSNGFTLIELLAVITIMGILMMVAIPTVSRTIENSRKDTFIDTAQKYAESAKTMWSGDNLYCATSNGNSYNSSAVPTGTYYIKIDTTSESVPILLEQGGKSSWGSRDIKGYVKIDVETKNILYGDVNLDGVINDADVTLVSRKLSGYSDDLDTRFGVIADVDGNGTLNSRDLALIARKADGANIAFPAGENYSSEKTTKFYIVISDDIHGVNIDSVTTEADQLVRGDLKMSGATYDKVEVPAASLLCVER